MLNKPRKVQFSTQYESDHLPFKTARSQVDGSMEIIELVEATRPGELTSRAGRSGFQESHEMN